MTPANNAYAHQRSRRRTGMPRARARYLAQALELEERSNTNMVSQGILLTTVLMVGAIVWSAFTSVNEIARTSGEVVPAGQVQSLQHLEGGIVAELMVRNGRRVKAGEVLLALADVNARSELEQLSARRAALDLRRRRLDALLSDTDPDFGEPAAPYTAAMITLQRQVYQTQLTAGAEQLQLIRAERGRLEEELAARSARVDSLTQEVSLLRDDLARQQKLVDRRLVPVTEVSNAALLLLRTQGDLYQVQGEWGSLQRQLGASRQRERELTSSRREAWDLEREEVSTSLSEVESRLAALRDRTERLALRSPIDGIVQGVAVSGPGAVVAPGQTVLQIVPIESRLLVEARVSPDDVGHLRAGQTVDIKVSSFEPQRYGTLIGQLTQVSPTTYLGDDRVPYYLAEIALDREYLGNAEQRFPLVPGMLVQADIITGRKTILDYLLKPVYRGFSSAMTER